MRLRLDLAYDGAGFRGFAPNVGVPTVSGALATAIEQVLSHPVSLTCAGRTDAGVHARRQVVHFDTSRDDIDPPRLRRSLDRLCGPEITISSVEPVPDEFSARFSAISRTYRYTILRAPLADPLRRHTAWHVAEPLDVAAMHAAAEEFLGLHDFGSFCRRHVGRSLERNVTSAAWSADDDLLVFEIVALSFCHQMVRSVVGTIVDVGLGNRRVADLAEVIAAQDRHAAPVIAPPHGLCLWDVTY